MTHGITWLQFWSVIGIGLAIYYGAFFLRIAKQKLLNKDVSHDGQPGTRKRVWSVSDKGQLEKEPLPGDDPLLEEFTSEHAATEEENEEERIFQSLELLAEEIEQAFADPAYNTTKQGLLDRLTERIQAYPLLKAPAFRSALVNVIARKAVECNIPIDRAEALALWDDPGIG